MAASPARGTMKITTQFSQDEFVWKNYSLNNAVNGIALQGNYVWCATQNGPVRWDIRDLSGKLFDGPPDNRLNTITSATDGSVWMGTPNGLTRFDGKSWTSFTTENGLPYGNVNLIATGFGDEVWAGMKRVEDHYNGTVRTWWIAERSGLTWITRFNEDDQYKQLGSLTSLAVRSNSDVWAVRGGRLLHFDGTAWKDSLNGEGMTQQPLSFLTLGTGNDLWVTGSGQISRFHDGTWTTHDFGNVTITALTKSSSGLIGVGLSLPDSTKILEVGSADGITWESNILGKGEEYIINAFAIDSAGVLWAGTPSGLYRFNNETLTLLNMKQQFPDPAARLIGADILDNAIIVSAHGDSLYDGYSCKPWVFPGGLPVSSLAVSQIHINPDGSAQLWTNYDTYFFDKTTWKKFTYTSAGLTGESVKKAVKATDGTIWADNSYAEGSPPSYIINIAHLVGNSWSTYKLLTGGWVSHYQVASLALGSDGKIWAIAFGNMGSVNNPYNVIFLFQFDGYSWSQVSSFYGDGPSAMAGPDGSIWIGGIPSRDNPSRVLSGGGLNHYKDGTMTSYSTVNGLLDNSVLSVAVSPNGTVWAQTEKGLSRFGNIIPTGVKSSQDIPKELSIRGNYPNPFNPSTIIEFTSPSSGKASLVVYDIMGRKVRELVSGQVSAGARTVQWDGRDDSGKVVSSGIYFARLIMGKSIVVKKMLMVK